MRGDRGLYIGLRACAVTAAPLLAAALLPAALLTTGCGEAQPPHLFLITSDALRPDHLSLNGYARETSPHLDRFAETATNFPNAVTLIPKTGASFTTMLTGLPPDEHGVEANQFTIPAEAGLLAEKLSAAGYQTGAFLGNPVLQGENGYARGFDHFVLYGKGDPVALVNAAFFRWSETLDWSRPVFAWVHYIDPHGPYTPPPELLAAFADDAIARADARRIPLDYEPIPGFPPHYALGALPRYQRIGREDRVAAYVARYDAEIRHMDAAFGELLASLERRGVLDRSGVLFASDHGESMGEGGYWFEHGWFADEPGLRIALLLKAPGQRVGARAEEPASALDVAPTLLALAGAAPDPAASGRNLLAPVPPDDLALLVANASTYPQRYQGLRSDDWKYLHRTRNLKIPGASDGRPDEMLFDLRSDPAESRNLAAEQPERTEALRAELEARLAAEGRRLAPGRTQPDEETRRQLEALGYVE